MFRQTIKSILSALLLFHSNTDCLKAQGYPDIDVDRRISYLEEQIGRVNGKLEELNHTLDVLKQNMPASNPLTPVAQDNVMSTMGKPALVSGANPLTDIVHIEKPHTDKNSSVAGLEYSLPDGPAQQEYEHAIALLHKAQYAQAQQALSLFLKRYPQHPLNVNAKYWLGETYLLQSRFAESAVMFAEVYQTFHQQNQTGASKAKLKQSRAKAPEALLKLVFALKGMKKDQDACATLTQLNQEFPQLPQNLVKLSEVAAAGLRCR